MQCESRLRRGVGPLATATPLGHNTSLSLFVFASCLKSKYDIIVAVVTR